MVDGLRSHHHKRWYRSQNAVDIGLKRPLSELPHENPYREVGTQRRSDQSTYFRCWHLVLREEQQLCTDHILVKRWSRRL
jgi:hypothetical protein